MDAPAGLAWSAARIAEEVRSGRADPCVAVEASLAAIAARDREVGAFISVRRDSALSEAAALRDHPALGRLPLAGVPVAIKDNLDVAGEPTRNGSHAIDPTPVSRDHPTVARLRAAGAIVVGKTHVPELSCWASTESRFGATRNPWNPRHVVGGSSGGSAAAVAAGMVPVAMGTDGLGSIRIPAAACGVFGLKPGPGLVPSELGASSWYGMSENGPLTTCVADARVMLGVLAADDSLSLRVDPPARLRIALSTKPPVLGTRVAPAWRRAAETAAAVLADAGHTVEGADPPYGALDALALGGRWTAGISQDVEGLDGRRLERRTLGHVRCGRILRTLGFEDERWRRSWQARLARFFETYDVLITPTLAQSPPLSKDWHERSWLANVWRDASYAPFPARFNLGAVPAASVPAGVNDSGLPVAAQLVAPRGGEAILLALAEQIEQRRGWQRHAPAFQPPPAV